MVHRPLLRVAGTALVALFVASCSDYGPTDGGPRFEVTPNWATVELGTTQQLNVTLDGEPVDVTWESSDPSVAGVSATGLVTPLKIGYTAVTATSTANPSLRFSSSITVPNLPELLASGASRTFAAATEQDVLYRVKVPAGATSLVVTTRGANGDADLYARLNQAPTKGVVRGGAPVGAGCHSAAGGSNETCTITAPTAGTYFILVDAYEGYTNLTLTATVTP